MAQDVASPLLKENSPLLANLPASRQMEVLERLKQLRVWQQQQQEGLLRWQQEQLMKLRSTELEEARQPFASTNEGIGNRDSTDVDIETPLPPHSLKLPNSSDRGIPQRHQFTMDSAGPPSSSSPVEHGAFLDSPRGSEIEDLNGEVVVYTDEEDDPGVINHHFPDHARTSDEDFFDRPQKNDTRTPDKQAMSPSHPTGGGASRERPIKPAVGAGGGTSRERPIKPAVGAGGGTSRERPIKPAVGASTTFEEFLDAQLKYHQGSTSASTNSVTASTEAGMQNGYSTPKKTFLKRGEGIARFGMKKIRIKHKSHTKTDQPITHTKEEAVLTSPKEDRDIISNPHHGHFSRSLSQSSLTEYETTSTSDNPVRLNRVRKVARQNSHQLYSSTESLPQMPLQVSTPSMTRFSSEESFILRKDQRLETEQAELKEFELLEQATDDNSFSSQCSLVVQLLKSPPSNLHHQIPPSQTSQPTKQQPRQAQLPGLELQHLDERERPSDGFGLEGIKEDIESPDKFQNFGHGIASTVPQVESTHFSRETSPVDDNVLDRTLTPLSPNCVFDFNDEEAWESFNQGSPFSSRQSKQFKDSSSDSVTPDMPTVDTSVPWVSPVKREQLNKNGVTVFISPLPAPSLLKDLDPTPTQSRPNPNPLDLNLPNDQPPQVSKPTNLQLPPPSALVSRLFPALRKDKQLDSKTEFPRPSQQVSGPTPLVNTPSPVQSSSSDSGKGSLSSTSLLMNDELRQKLCQLETEIERFRSENATLERLRREKEEAVAHLKLEIAEFQRQKEEEMARFEEYKKEEIRKLKKDRRVFEAYQQEARAARDRRDKEDIETLRNELQNLQEELQRRESRWGATLSRYRMKIDSLEAQNRELQSDIKVMEQDRLQWWQQQVHQQELQTKKLKTTPVQSSKKGAVSLKAGNTGQKPTTTLLSTTSGQPKPLKKPAAVKRNFTLQQTLRNAAKDKQKEPGIKCSKAPTPDAEPFVESDSDEIGLDVERVQKVTDDSSVSGEECEILEVVGQDYTDSETDGESNASRADSELSILAENVVNQVLGEENQQLQPKPLSSEPLTRQSSDDSVAKKDAKSVRFVFKADAPPISHLESEVSERLLPPKESDSKVVSVQQDGSKLIVFPNGTRKAISVDGRSTSVHFFNGDIKHIKPDQTVVYYYADSKTTHTTYQDGLEVLEFPNNQSEKHYPNGTKEITFPDQTVKYMYPNGEEESVFPDSTVQKLHPNGDRTIIFSNGQKEFHTKEFKRREYPDGTVKTVYPDGKQETRYASGRFRVKDKSGNVLIDRNDT